MIIIMWMLIILFSLVYVVHISNTINLSREEDKRFGWTTIIIFIQLFRDKRNNVEYIHNYLLVIINDIYILFDPISFILSYLIILFIKMIELIKNLISSDLFKTYNKIEAEKILDKLME